MISKALQKLSGCNAYSHPACNIKRIRLTLQLLFGICALCTFFLSAPSTVGAQTLEYSTPLDANTEATQPIPAELPACQDLRNSVIAHRNMEYGARLTPRRLSKNELENLRRVIREHARNNPLQTAVNN